ncbi:MAG: Uncharacterized protein XD93_0481 [candidate division WS6 bacterium 34_10]|uniref:Bacteriophage lambda Replication protein O N-terminal domain-containing protein n=1 Tax=candidate division WS6 bacterium 34_10 TaxID=1641389 RepID=A0A124FX78_9BACT|nr:MAG: Uncharacterized protein XD93_0481 [candidate division WS6 bacterium 34_10]
MENQTIGKIQNKNNSMKNFTRIENDILEKLSEINLSGSALACALVLLRKTNGFGKTQDGISLSQFEKLVNRSKPTICKALRELQLVNICLLVKKGKSLKSFNIYAFNKDVSSWKLVKKTELVKKKKRTSKENDTQLVKKSLHTKENNTKENKQKIYEGNKLIEEVQLKEIVSFYNELFDKNISSTKGFEKNYDFWKEIHGIEKIRKALENARKDKFWKDKMTLTILFRRKNPNGEPVDYIEDLSNRTISSSGSVAIV